MRPELVENPELEQISESAILMYTYFDNKDVMCHKAIHIDGALMHDNPTLAEISEKYKDECDDFMLICESPLSGKIFRFNNYGDGNWYKIGETCGYA